MSLRYELIATDGAARRTHGRCVEQRQFSPFRPDFALPCPASSCVRSPSETDAPVTNSLRSIPDRDRAPRVAPPRSLHHGSQS